MARWEFKLPDIGEGVTEGEIVHWLIQPGDLIREDQPMVEVMTDKATVTITSPKTGTIVELFGKVGEIVKVHSPLVAFELESISFTPPTPVQKQPSKDTSPAATAVGDIKEDLPGLSLMHSSHEAAAPTKSTYFSDKPLATPATRKLARDLEIDLRHVPPTGPNGRVVKDDIVRFRDHQTTNGKSVNSSLATASHTSMPSTREPVRIDSTLQIGSDVDTRTPFIGVRRKIAEKMSLSKNTAAHFTFVEECDCTELIKLRERLKSRVEKEGAKLTYLAFIAKAVVVALRKHPHLNCALDESTNELVVRHAIHLGIAASTDAGLIVPVVHHAERCSILDLAREIERLGTGAKQGKLKPNELSGSTFTITSLGQQGGLFATPIINFPEVAILGVHQIKKKPVVRGDQIVIGDVMLLSLSFDHRIIDGHVGAAFAYEVIDLLQNPDRLMLEG